MQTIKAQKTKYSGKALAVTAMFAALITAATAFIKISGAPRLRTRRRLRHLSGSLHPACAVRVYRGVRRRRSRRSALGLCGMGDPHRCHQGAERAAVFSRAQISPKERPRHAHFASAHPFHAAAHHSRHVSRLLCRQHGFVRLSRGLGGGAVQSGAVSRRRRSVYRPGTHARCGKIQAKISLK